MGACSSKPNHSELEDHSDHFLDTQPTHDALPSTTTLSGFHGDDGKISSFQSWHHVANGNCDLPHALSQTMKLSASDSTAEEPRRNCAILECKETDFCERIAQKEAVFVEKSEAEAEEEVLKERIVVTSRKKEACVAEKEISMESSGGEEDRKAETDVVGERLGGGQGFRCENRQEGGSLSELNKVLPSSRLEFRKNSYRHSYVSKDDVGLCRSTADHEDYWLKNGDGSKRDNKFVGYVEAQKDEAARNPARKEDQDTPSLRMPVEFISNKDILATEIDAMLEKLASEFERQESLSSFRSFRSPG